MRDSPQQRDSAADGSTRSRVRLNSIPGRGCHQPNQARRPGLGGQGVPHLCTCLTHKAQHKGYKLQTAPSFRECLFRLLRALKSQSTKQGSYLCLNTQELPSYNAWERKGRAGHCKLPAWPAPNTSDARSPLQDPSSDWKT